MTIDLSSIEVCFSGTPNRNRNWGQGHFQGHLLFSEGHLLSLGCVSRSCIVLKVADVSESRSCIVLRIMGGSGSRPSIVLKVIVVKAAAAHGYIRSAPGPSRHSQS